MEKIAFKKKGPFAVALTQKVEAYFATHKIEKTGNLHLWFKALVLVGAALVLYICLLTVVFPAWVALLLCALVGMVLASIGFNIMHDACHGAFSKKKWINEGMVLSLNALGGNAFLFKQKHLLHHNYTNIDGMDDDIAKSPLLRQCASQKWVPAHRYQHLYVFLMYPLSGLVWITAFDFTKYFQKRICNMPLRRMDLREHLVFWISKVLYVFFYIVLPVWMVGAQQWLAGYLLMNVVMGITMALVFQLGHVVEQTTFYAGVPGMLPVDWAEHEVQSSANFGIGSKALTWFVGGLNYQVEHHLFPRISHVHYPAISRIVQETSKAYGLPYHSFPTMASAVASHFRLLKELGRQPDGVAVPEAVCGA